MEKQTFERALHQWPDWHESIESSRTILGYDVHASPEERDKWVCDHVPELREQYHNELNRLNLPPSLYPYWCSCFYNNYKNEKGEIDYTKITSYIPTESSPSYKALPELPCEQHIEWYENEDIHDPYIRIVIRLDTRFHTKALLDYSLKHVLNNIERFIEDEQIPPHPITEQLKGGRPSLNKTELAVECAHLKDDLHWTYVQIGEHNDWNIQKDSYGSLNQCSTARRYVKMGREIRNNTNH